MLGTVNFPENEPWGEVVIAWARLMLSPPKVILETWVSAGKLDPLNDTEVPTVSLLGVTEKMGMS